MFLSPIVVMIDSAPQGHRAAKGAREIGREWRIRPRIQIGNQRLVGHWETPDRG
jgi:L-arabinose isomerase